MKPVEGSEFLLDVDLVLIAAGFLGSQEYVTKAFGVNVDGRTNVATEPGKHATNVKMSSPQAICIWVSHWSFVRSVKEETSQEKWMSH